MQLVGKAIEVEQVFMCSKVKYFGIQLPCLLSCNYTACCDLTNVRYSDLFLKYLQRTIYKTKFARRILDLV